MTSIIAARQQEITDAFQRLDAIAESLRGLSMTRAAALGETSEATVRRWAIERGHDDLFKIKWFIPKKIKRRPKKMPK